MLMGLTLRWKRLRSGTTTGTTTEQPTKGEDYYISCARKHNSIYLKLVNQKNRSINPITTVEIDSKLMAQM